MAQASVVAFNIGAFISTLFLLEFGADKFIAHASALARRIGVSEVIVGLVTAGAEWEELAVVIASLAQHRPSLAIGNVVGAAISNILGAFSLGLLFHDERTTIEFDRSSRIYSLLVLSLTTIVIPILYFPSRIVWLVCGPVLIAIFGTYFLLLAAAIGRGVLTAPEDSDSDSDDSDEGEEEEGNGDNDGDYEGQETGYGATSTTGLLSDSSSPGAPQATQHRGGRRGLGHHGLRLVFGFLAICLAGYVLSQAAVNIIDQFGISDVLFGVIVLAMATTLPEKFIAAMSGARGHAGILVANCAGSNIFLLSLCCGVIMTTVEADNALGGGGNVTTSELAVLWASTAAFTGTIWFGAAYSRWIGWAMLVAYVAFIVLEFTVIHRVID